MTVAEAELAVGGTCRQAMCSSPKFDTSHFAQQKMHITITQHLPEEKINKVHFHFIASNDVAAVLRSISADYRVSLGATCSGIHPTADLNTGKEVGSFAPKRAGLVLRVRCGFGGSYPNGSLNYYLEIEDLDLVASDNNALLAKQRTTAPPTPRF
jgi:hypothetical protein